EEVRLHERAALLQASDAEVRARRHVAARHDHLGPEVEQPLGQAGADEPGRAGDEHGNALVAVVHGAAPYRAARAAALGCHRMTDPALRDRLAQTSWYHSIELAPGLVTPGWFDTRAVPERIGFPASLA